MSALAPCAALGQPTARVPEPLYLDVTLNGQKRGEPLLFLKGDDGTLYASVAAFKEWRLALPTVPPITADGEDYYALSALPGTRIRVSASDQAVSIDARPESFASQALSIGIGEDVPMTPSSTGAFLGYDLFADGVQGSATTISGGFDAGIFTQRGVLTTSFVGAVGGQESRLVRLDTTYIIDRPDRLTSLRFGDSISSAGTGTAPVRFAGIHFSRNFAVQPGFVTTPLPSATGSATVPSIVDLYVNNMLTSSREVAPGPFTLSNIPVNSGGGTFRVVVRDVLGRERILERSFYASSVLLRRGLHDFSYEAGFARRRFGEESLRYGEAFVSTTHRYGMSDTLTVEGNLQASAQRQVAGVGATLLAFGLGQVGTSVSASRSARGSGYRVAASVERAATRFSFGVRGEYTSDRYAYVGIPDDFRLARYTVQTFADVPVPYGSLGVNFVLRDTRMGEHESVAAVSGQVQLGKFGSLNLFARHAFAGRRRTDIGLNLTVSLGGQHSASIGVERGMRGLDGYVTLQKNAPVGLGAGYRLSTSFGEARVSEAAYTYNLPAATVGARLAHANGVSGLRLSAVGGVGVIDGQVFASRFIGESFARVSVANIAGVRVYSDNQLVGVTGRGGTLVIPGLRPFEANKIRIDDTDLPFDTRLGATEILVRPYARAGASVRFDVARERGVLMQVRLDDGRPLPAGARVTGPAIADDLIAVAGGEVYAPALAGKHRLTATWADGRCIFDVEVPVTDDPQPRIDGLICRDIANAKR